MFNKKITLLISLFIFSPFTLAEMDSDNTKQAAQEFSKELSNPNTALASLTLKEQFASGDDYESLTTVFQPSMPFPLDNGGSILFRPAIAYSKTETQFGSTSGFSDISFDLAYAPALDDGQLLAFGMFAQLPTGSEGFSEQQLAVGPEVLYGKITESYAVGAFPNHLWGVEDTKAFNKTSMQLFFIKILDNGWTVGSTPIMSYDWNEEQAVVPLNLTIRKTMMFGQRPVQIALEGNYYIEQKTGAPDFMLSINITPVVKNHLADLF